MQLAGKRVGWGVVASAGDGPGRLFFIRDNNCNKRFLVDTGSSFLILPFVSTKPPHGPALYPADRRRSHLSHLRFWQVSHLRLQQVSHLWLHQHSHLWLQQDSHQLPAADFPEWAKVLDEFPEVTAKSWRPGPPGHAAEHAIETDG
jgi:hypothetical protein